MCRKFHDQLHWLLASKALSSMEWKWQLKFWLPPENLRNMHFIYLSSKNLEQNIRFRTLLKCKPFSTAQIKFTNYKPGRKSWPHWEQQWTSSIAMRDRRPSPYIFCTFVMKFLLFASFSGVIYSSLSFPFLFNMACNKELTIHTSFLPYCHLH